MDYKETILQIAGPKYSCIENEQVDNASVITVESTKSKRLVLNYEIESNNLKVHVIDKSTGNIVDEYKADYDSDKKLESRIRTSISTFQTICRSRAKKEAAETADRDKKFREILADGSPELFQKLDIEELEALDQFLLDNVSGGLGRDIAHFVIQGEIENRQFDGRKVEDADPEELTPPIEDVSTTDSDEDEILLSDASPVQLLEQFINCVSEKIDDEEDEVTSRIYDDLSAQAEEMVEELSQIADE